jgi:tetratricopeptide (TPR) repeat protein
LLADLRPGEGGMTGTSHSRPKKILFVVVSVTLCISVFYCYRTLQSPDVYFDIYVLGGSTAKGRPYNPSIDIGKLVDYYFGGQINGRPIRIINLARGGKPASYAYKRVYSGNNEFLRLFRKHDPSKTERTLFDKPLVSPEERLRVLDSYEKAIEKIILRCKKRGVPIVVSTVAVNTSDIAPNRSRLSDSADPSQVRDRLHNGNLARSRGNCQQAMVDYDEIISTSPDFALAYYLAADCLREQGIFDRARDYYDKARDLDASPYRVLTAQNVILGKLASKHRVPLVDAVSILENAAPNGLVGYNFMWDNCHPTLEGYALIADGFAERTERLFNAKRQVAEVNLEDIERHFSLTKEAEFEIMISCAQFMYRYATLVWDPAARLAQADRYLEKANDLKPGAVEYYCAKATLNVIRGDREAALRFWQKAYAIDPDIVRERIKNRHLRPFLKRIDIQSARELVRQISS